MKAYTVVLVGEYGDIIADTVHVASLDDVMEKAKEVAPRTEVVAVFEGTARLVHGGNLKGWRPAEPE